MLPLMGRPESWHGKGGKPLGVLEDGVLRQAKRFFESCLRERADRRLQQQIEAINVILTHRAANSPQGMLAL